MTSARSFPRARSATAASADFSNVLPFARPRGSDAPEVVLPAELARVPGTGASSARAGAPAPRSRWLVHGGLLTLFLLHQEPPLDSIGLEVMSVEIVLGATAPAGVATTPGENQAQSTSAPEEQSTEVAQTEPKATEQQQTVEVAKQETAPEQKTEQPKTEAKPDEPKQYETAAAPEQQPAQAEPKPTVAMVESPTPEMATAAPRETPPDTTEVTLLPQPEDKPVEKKPDPKPVQAAPPKPVKNAAPAKEQRRIAAPTREKAAKEAKASTPSSQANNVGVGRSDRDTNYPGLVSAHLRRYQQYPADARSRGDQGTRVGDLRHRRQRRRDLGAARAQLRGWQHRPGSAGYGAARVAVPGTARRAGAELHHSGEFPFELIASLIASGSTLRRLAMFIAMNRFQVVKGSEEAFERMWQSRDSYLDEMAGFVEFHLLKGPEAEDHTLYSSHTVWASKADFEAWTKSEQFRRAHARAGNDGNAAPLYLGHPKFEGFEVKQTLAAQGQGRLMQLAAAKPDLASVLAADPGAVIETVAKEHGVTTREVVEALPAAMRRSRRPSAFIDAMKDIATWGEVTLIVHTDDGIMEFTGPIPAGEVGRGYFNLMGAHRLPRPSAPRALRAASPSWSGRSWAASRRRSCSSTSTAASCSRCSSAATRSANCWRISWRNSARWRSGWGRRRRRTIAAVILRCAAQAARLEGWPQQLGALGHPSRRALRAPQDEEPVLFPAHVLRQPERQLRPVRSPSPAPRT